MQCKEFRQTSFTDWSLNELVNAVGLAIIAISSQRAMSGNERVHRYDKLIELVQQCFGKLFKFTVKASYTLRATPRRCDSSQKHPNKADH